MNATFSDLFGLAFRAVPALLLALLLWALLIAAIGAILGMALILVLGVLGAVVAA